MKLKQLLLPAILAVTVSGAYAQPKKAVCAECGTVTAIKVVEKDGEGSATGVIAGGVAGALLGNQVGSGSGKAIATVAGAAGGAYAGKAIEGKMNKVKEWHISVKYDTGKIGSVVLKEDPHLRKGDKVKRENGHLNRI
ncbi:MAG: glycine zipper protein [Pseudoduganella sp.]|jgi:outer membrane lipoprotein SlyB|nr:glycine zipper protein [Pseudoduganella sp.]